MRDHSCKRPYSDGMVQLSEIAEKTYGDAQQIVGGQDDKDRAIKPCTQPAELTSTRHAAFHPIPSFEMFHTREMLTGDSVSHSVEMVTLNKLSRIAKNTQHVFHSSDKWYMEVRMRLRERQQIRCMRK